MGYRLFGNEHTNFGLELHFRSLKISNRQSTWQPVAGIFRNRFRYRCRCYRIDCQ